MRAGITQLPIIKTFSAFIITILPWLIWSTLYFGSPIPHSIAAKVATLTVSPGGAFSFMLPRLTTPFLESDVFGFIGTLVALVLYIAMSAISLLYAIRNAPRLLPVLIFPWVYLAVFSIANPLIFRWYLIPPMPALILSILIGLYALITSGKPSRQRTFTVALTIAGAVWIICALNAWTLHPDHSPDRPAPKMAWHLQELDYQKAALELVEKYGVTPTTTIAAPDIGAVGYFSRAHIIDTVGLVSPQVMKYYPMSKGIVPEPFTYAIPPQLILDMQPDYIVVMEAAVRLGLEKNVDFKTLYGDPIILIPTDFYGTDMRVYKRK